MVFVVHKIDCTVGYQETICAHKIVNREPCGKKVMVERIILK
jgi:hypothetical protein